MRGVDVDGLDIDAPWLLEEPGRLIVNGVDVAPLVDDELDLLVAPIVAESRIHQMSTAVSPCGGG
ncbi:hypothetical protein GCM10022376_21120 [Yimella lutea]